MSASPDLEPSALRAERARARVDSASAPADSASDSASAPADSDSAPAGSAGTAASDASAAPAARASNGNGLDEPVAAAAAVLPALAERVRTLRARRGLTRKALAAAAGISERHLANLEHGTGNASILILHQLAAALHCALAELVGDVTTDSSEWLLIRELLENRSEADLRRARLRLSELFDNATGDERLRRSHIALVGLRGAGKSTLGRMLAEDLDFPFVELGREIEKLAGCGISQIHSLYGANAYRRYERRAVEEVIQIFPEVVMATPGGLVSDSATFNLLLAHCYTVWLQADPEDHMRRVREQGDLRPMSGPGAMEDLRRILAGRASFYAKADLAYRTSGKTLEQCFAGLRAQVRAAILEAG
ncbi:MAG: helix-turn-helix transcriptional regulator [Burkholderiaceae bacterium]|nr:helix-turn-helix transcriptional regulator [Burkholderiaceae bacterium]